MKKTILLLLLFLSIQTNAQYYLDKYDIKSRVPFREENCGQIALKFNIYSVDVDNLDRIGTYDSLYLHSKYIKRGFKLTSSASNGLYSNPEWRTPKAPVEFMDTFFVPTAIRDSIKFLVLDPIDMKYRNMNFSKIHRRKFEKFVAKEVKLMPNLEEVQYVMDPFGVIPNIVLRNLSPKVRSICLDFYNGFNRPNKIEIGDYIAKMPSLKYLRIITYHLDKPIELPASVYNCNNIEYLELYANTQSIYFSDSICKMKNLKFLSVYSGESLNYEKLECMVKNGLQAIRVRGCIEYLDAYKGIKEFSCPAHCFSVRCESIHSLEKLEYLELLWDYKQTKPTQQKIISELKKLLNLKKIKFQIIEKGNLEEFKKALPNVEIVCDNLVEDGTL